MISQEVLSGHANLANDILGVAPSYVPSRPRGWERSQPGHGPEGLIKERAPNFSDPAETIILDMQNEDGPDLFKTQTSSATVKQVTIQTNCHPNLPGHTIRNLISPHQVLLLNYGRADTWYFASDSFNAADLDCTTKQIAARGQQSRIHFLDFANVYEYH